MLRSGSNRVLFRNVQTLRQQQQLLQLLPAAAAPRNPGAAAACGMGGRGRIDLGLARVRRALGAVGAPQRALAGRVLHVAGTNGKGSVCAMAFAALRQAGLSAGLFSSPFLVEPLDAVRLARRGVERGPDPAQWAVLQAELAAAEPELTSFELQAATALLLFAREGVDAAVVEVGLGGAEDATNVLERPAACAVTSIARDHEVSPRGRTRR
jgi:dihydrofolate synthase/folylpolyglutamate synthase